MTFVQIFQLLAAIGTILTGLVSMIRPRAVRSFTGLEVDNSRGITEIRAVLGGFFVALGAAPLILGHQSTYRMLGIAYLVVGAVRAVSMFVDDSVVRSNLISLAVEIVFGFILIL